MICSGLFLFLLRGSLFGEYASIVGGDIHSEEKYIFTTL
jgi:hypothetical protein